MANLFVNAKMIGDGVIRFASSSQYIITQLTKNTCGVYSPNTNNYKFLLSGKLLKIVAITGSIQSSSIDNSFTVLAGNTTASVDVYFSPAKQYDFMIPKKYEESVSPTMPIIANSMVSPPIDTTEKYSGYPEPTTEDYDRGYMFRYFYKQANNPDAIVKETAEYQFDSVSSFYLYKSLKIKWKIVGPAGLAEQTNINISDEAEKNLAGIKSILSRDYLLFWRNLPDIIDVFNVTDRIKTYGA